MEQLLPNLNHGTKRGQMIAMAVCAIAGLLFLVSLYNTGSWLWGYFKKPTQILPTQTQLIQKTLPNIASMHLFGQYISPNLNASNIPTTQLQIKLHGIFAATPAQYSQAVISVQGQKQKVYHVGDRLPSGVEVYQILPKGVILRSGGKLQKLTLPKDPSPFSPPPKPNL